MRFMNRNIPVLRLLAGVLEGKILLRVSNHEPNGLKIFHTEPLVVLCLDG